MSMKGCILVEIAKVKARSSNQLTIVKIASDSWVVGYLDTISTKDGRYHKSVR